jgi:hypothetical protein
MGPRGPPGGVGGGSGYAASMKHTGDHPALLWNIAGRVAMVVCALQVPSLGLARAEIWCQGDRKGVLEEVEDIVVGCSAKASGAHLD